MLEQSFQAAENECEEDKDDDALLLEMGGPKDSAAFLPGEQDPILHHDMSASLGDSISLEHEDMNDFFTLMLWKVVMIHN